ncbi:putative WW domain-containing oxidoreductase [Hypsibius exemplaris]|uniref:WW domain-containing oxidoreductase n=1 Tax=Hypsibius exemplaris TaxID=2072580 RepID=A0A1W0WS25_HYPEX|nr:putative WW domain-containing oxidoreductase [Hypsibius exemplaris]
MAANKLPFKRRFTSRSTATQVLQDETIEGKTILVTGGSSGIGVATVEALAKKGATVIFTGRNVSSSEELIRNLKVSTPFAKVDFMPLNLCSLKDVQRKLDIVIFNAGMFGGSHTVTEDGYEAAFQVNVLSQLYLLNFLKPTIFKSTPARIVFVSSDGHRGTNLTLEKLSEEALSPPSKDSYPWRQYANSKYCQILLSAYIQKHWSSSGVTSYALHPGHLIATNIVREWSLGSAFAWLAKPFTKTLEQGAATTVYCAAAAELADQGGKYWNHCWVCEPVVREQQAKLEEAVWQLCQKMIVDKVPGYIIPE